MKLLLIPPYVQISQKIHPSPPFVEILSLGHVGVFFFNLIKSRAPRLKIFEKDMRIGAGKNNCANSLGADCTVTLQRKRQESELVQKAKGARQQTRESGHFQLQ